MTRLLSRPARRRLARGARSRAGFTLTELLVSMTLLSVVMGSVVSVITTVQRDYARQRTRDGSMTAVRSAELLIGRVFRTAGADPNKVGVVGISAQPNGTGSVRVRADFNPADGDTNDDLEDVTIDLSGQDLRVKGWVKQGTMQWDAATNRLAFDLSRKDGSEPVPVAYTGILPDMFAEGREVVVEGRYESPGLKAKQIMTSCPSKYEAEREQGAKHPGA